MRGDGDVHRRPQLCEQPGHRGSGRRHDHDLSGRERHGSEQFPDHEGQRLVHDQPGVPTTTVTVANATYDGNPHGGTASVTGAGGLSQSLTVSYSGRNGTVYGPSTTAPTNVGDYTASASFGGDANHDGSNDSKDYSIGKAAVTATAGSGSATYDGASKSPSACAVTGTFTGDLSCTNSPATVGPDAGTTTIYPVVSGAGQSNFQITKVNGSYTINPASSITTVTVANA